MTFLIVLACVLVPVLAILSVDLLCLLGRPRDRS